jgi:hypothetical protein
VPPLEGQAGTGTVVLNYLKMKIIAELFIGASY